MIAEFQIMSFIREGFSFPQLGSCGEELRQVGTKLGRWLLCSLGKTVGLFLLLWCSSSKLLMESSKKTVDNLFLPQQIFIFSSLLPDLCSFKFSNQSLEGDGFCVWSKHPFFSRILSPTYRWETSCWILDSLGLVPQHLKTQLEFSKCTLWKSNL